MRGCDNPLILSEWPKDLGLGPPSLTWTGWSYQQMSKWIDIWALPLVILPSETQSMVDSLTIGRDALLESQEYSIKLALPFASVVYSAVWPLTPVDWAPSMIGWCVLWHLTSQWRVNQHVGYSLIVDSRHLLWVLLWTVIVFKTFIGLFKQHTSMGVNVLQFYVFSDSCPCCCHHPETVRGGSSKKTGCDHMISGAV